MKNALLKSFLFLVIFCNIAFFGYIADIVLSVKALVLELLHFDIFIVIFAIFLIAVLVSFLVYFFKHLDKKQVVPTVEFKSPDNMNPAEVGFLIDGVVDGEDISAMIVYWAGKKYLSISNDKKNQKLTKLVDKLSDESKNYEKILFDKIFGADKEVLVKNIPQRLEANQTVTNVVNLIEHDTENKYFDKKSITYRQMFICLIATLFYFSVFYFGAELYYMFGVFAAVSTVLFIICADWVLNYYDYRHKNKTFRGRLISFIFFLILIGAIATGCMVLFIMFGQLYQAFVLLAVCVCMLLIVMLSRKIRIYNKNGFEKLGEIIGFREFIKTAEADRIKMLVEENPNIYYDVLPYAYVLGVSDKWIKNLNVIQNDCPNIVDKKMLSAIIVYSILLSTTSLGIFNILSVAGSGIKSLFSKK